jgi:fatty-acyl-CoA synthase
VVAVADRFWGEVVGAVIRTSADTPPTAAELSEFCRGRLAAYKIPARWAFTSTFPLTATGKIRKDVLSAQLADAPGPAGLAAAGGERIPGGRTTARSVK